tara:strand:+ start:582 stop:1583 length:1002 start_codon:yes stop_codon:yes gene_type:complete
MKKYIFLFIAIIIASCDSPPKEKAKSLVEIYDSSIELIIDKDLTIERLVDSLIVSEGPLWDENSKSLLYTDVALNKIFKWNETDGASIYISPSGNSGYAPNLNEGLLGGNGVIFDNEGNLIICQHGDRRVAMIENSASDSPIFKTIVDNSEGKRFNSPNDLVMSKDGSIYFTDPPYGFFDLPTLTFNDTIQEIDYSGVYKIDNENQLSVISNDLSLPNGIALSLDEKYLYVNNSDGKNPIMTRYDLENNTNEVFFDGTEMASKFEGGFDGMKVHSSGNIFTTGPNGLLVISPEGKLLATIDFGGGITNCAFDNNEEFLYVTGFTHVSRIKLKN